jgi:hypothetical protein
LTRLLAAKEVRLPDRSEPRQPGRGSGLSHVGEKPLPRLNCYLASDRGEAWQTSEDQHCWITR